ncbi:MAG: hypothetical protein HQ517_07720, partial [SAR324 cluster bacterium]|nr:hypothetical protein [SAR324 cluster bacterium]
AAEIELPTIVMTGYADKQMVVSLLKRGIDAFLEKPVNNESLLETIGQVIELAEAGNQAKKQEQKKFEEEQDISTFFSTIFYVFILANLDAKSVKELLISIESFLQEEMRLDVLLKLETGEFCGEFQPEESTLFLEAAAIDELYFKTENCLICTIPPLQVMVRRPTADFDQDKLDVFVSAAASRLTFAISEDNKRIMNGVAGDSVFMVNSKGQIEPGATTACLKIFNVTDHETLLNTPPGELLYGKIKDAELFREWIDLCYDGPLDFGDLQLLQPSEITTENGRILALEIFPIYTEDAQLIHIVFKFNDITLLRNNQKELEHRDQSNLAVIKVIQQRQAFKSYTELIENSFSKSDQIFAAKPVELIRALHTAKGLSGLFSFKTVQQKCHDAETLLLAGNEITHNSEVLKLILSISAFVDDFLKKNENVLQAVFGSDERIHAVDRNWYDHLQKLYLQKSELRQTGVGNLFKQLAFVPLKNCFEHYKTILQDIATSRGKMLESLVINDQMNIFVPDPILKPLVNSLIHIFRNAVDHGIETPDVRKALNKDENGHIELSLTHNDESLLIQIEDDGQGIDTQKLTAAAITKGLFEADQVEKMSTAEIKQLVFQDGISMKNEADLVSGRGVGMADVKNSCQLLEGQIDYETTLGKGTCWQITIPLKVIYGEDVLSGFFSTGIISP